MFEFWIIFVVKRLKTFSLQQEEEETESVISDEYSGLKSLVHKSDFQKKMKRFTYDTFKTRKRSYDSPLFGKFNEMNEDYLNVLSLYGSLKGQRKNSRKSTSTSSGTILQQKNSEFVQSASVVRLKAETSTVKDRKPYKSVSMKTLDDRQSLVLEEEVSLFERNSA